MTRKPDDSLQEALSFILDRIPDGRNKRQQRLDIAKKPFFVVGSLAIFFAAWRYITTRSKKTEKTEYNIHNNGSIPCVESVDNHIEMIAQ